MKRDKPLRNRLSGAASWQRGRSIPLLARIESQVALPGDSDTRRFQKMLVVVVTLLGSVATVFNARPFFNGGLETMGWTYIGSAVVLLIGGLVILAWPSLYVPTTFIILLDVIVFPAITQVLSGGYGSGILAMHWTLLAPLGAVLALGARLALVHLALFVITVVAVAAMEPFSRSIAPEISSEVLLGYNVPSLLSLGLIAALPISYLLRQVHRLREQADVLLLNVLPASVATRLKAGEAPIADEHADVTILFADIVEFTQLSSGAEAEAIVGLLNEIFSEFDDLAAKHGVEKIKTIGDAYMAATGLTESRADDPRAIIEFAIDLLEAVKGRTWPAGEPVRLRIGIHAGPVVAGVIGHERFIYDLWGDAVNFASRMESTAPIDGIQVTEVVKQRLETTYEFEQRHEFPVKGKGMTVTYTLATDKAAHHSLDRSSPPEPVAATVLPAG